MSYSSPAITLYTFGTPNGWKASILLELLHIPYDVKSLDISTGVQKEDWFLKICPNGRIPAIVDHKHGDFNVFESGAIMLWLVQNYDPEHKFWPADPKAQSQVTQWVMFQMGGVGHMQGQANHFSLYAPEKIEYGIKRYKDETKRLYTVLESQLQGRNYLVGDHLTIADIINFSWVVCYSYINIDISDLPNLQAWLKRIIAVPEVRKGLVVPEETDRIKGVIANIDNL